MRDKRSFYFLINAAKEEFPNNIPLLEAIKSEFDTIFESISPRQRMALREFPLQFVKRIIETDGGWTTQLHIWAEEGIEDILNLDPVYLSLKNYHGDTVLMNLMAGATGSLTGITNYELIEKILKKDYSYVEESKDKDGNITVEDKNVLDEIDVFNQTVLDYLVDVAYADGEYKDEEPDPQLQQLIIGYLGSFYDKNDEIEQSPTSKTFITTEQKEEVEEVNDEIASPIKDEKTEERKLEEDAIKSDSLEEIENIPKESPLLSQSSVTPGTEDHTSQRKDKEVHLN